MEKLDQLREEYKTADKKRREDIIGMLCRECKKQLPLPQTDPDWPFCSSRCHTIWGDKTYGKAGEKASAGGRPSIEELQRRIAEIVKEKHLKKYEKQQPLL